MYVGEAIFINFFFTWYIFWFQSFHIYMQVPIFVFSFWSISVTVQKSVFYSCFVVLKKNKDLMSYSFAANCNCMHSFEVFVMWDVEWIKQLWGSFSVAIMGVKVCICKCLLLNTSMLLMGGSTFSCLGG